MDRVVERLHQLSFNTWSSRHQLYFLHDNARTHATALTQDRLFDLNWAIVPHASYSPDKFPCDYALFRSMEHNLSGKVFEDEDDVHEFLEEWFSSKKKSFFHDAFDKLPEIWQEIIDNGGAYIKQ